MAKATIEGYKIAEGQSLAGSFVLATVTNMNTIDNLAINISTSDVSDNQGYFYVQHRIKKNQREFSAWATLTLSTTPLLNDADDTFLINLNQVPRGEIRIGFTAAGGTPDGTCDIWVSGTSVGGK